MGAYRAKMNRSEYIHTRVYFEREALTFWKFICICLG